MICVQVVSHMVDAKHVSDQQLITLTSVLLLKALHILSDSFGQLGFDC